VALNLKSVTHKPWKSNRSWMARQAVELSRRTMNLTELEPAALDLGIHICKSTVPVVVHLARSRFCHNS
jgi:hypothetical protein